MVWFDIPKVLVITRSKFVIYWMLKSRHRSRFNICMINDIGEYGNYLHLLLKLNINVVVNRLRDHLLGNTVDLTPLTQTWVAMRSSCDNTNNLLKLHIIRQGCYIRREQWNLTPTNFSHCWNTESLNLFFVVLFFKHSPNNQSSDKPNLK